MIGNELNYSICLSPGASLEIEQKVFVLQTLKTKEFYWEIFCGSTQTRQSLSNTPSLGSYIFNYDMFRCSHSLETTTT